MWELIEDTGDEIVIRRGENTKLAIKETPEGGWIKHPVKGTYFKGEIITHLPNCDIWREGEVVVYDYKTGILVMP